MTADRKATFLEHLRQHGHTIAAAKAASPFSQKGAHASFYDEKLRDPKFSADWDQALQEADDALILEIRKRGIDGIQEDVYGSLGPQQGTGVVGQRRVYSDKMAELYARIMSLRVRQALTNQIELQARVQVEPIGLERLTVEQQSKLESLLLEAVESAEPDDSGPSLLEG